MASLPFRPSRRLGLTLALCALSVAAGAAAAGTAPTRADVAWLNRISFGVDSRMLAAYGQLGRERFLAQQLSASAGPLPARVQAQVDQLEAGGASAGDLADELMQARRQIQDTDDAKAKAALRKKLRKHGRDLAYQAAQAQMLRAIYSPNQLREQMVWFWANHFSVFSRKAVVSWFIPDYIDHAIRPHALGHFRDLVMATLKSPAMLVYLDNLRNKRGKNNENYARELMELHVLGVHAGYTQRDVQALMHILSGAGIAPPARSARFAARVPGAVLDGVFVFNPRQHDDAPQVLLGKRIDARGFRQVEEAVDWLTRQPACARFISGEIASYFVSDHPPQALVDRMSATFQRTDGDIAAVLRTLFTAPELTTSGAKFKDPMQYAVSAMRLAYDGRPVPDVRRLVLALRVMGEPLYGRITPDGWSLDGDDWHSSGQMTDRFRVARMIASGAAVLPPGSRRAGWNLSLVPDIADSKAYRATLAPRLSANTRSVLDSARNAIEWNGYLLASPVFNMR